MFIDKLTVTNIGQSQGPWTTVRGLLSQIGMDDAFHCKGGVPPEYGGAGLGLLGLVR